MTFLMRKIFKKQSKELFYVNNIISWCFIRTLDEARFVRDKE